MLSGDLLALRGRANELYLMISALLRWLVCCLQQWCVVARGGVAILIRIQLEREVSARLPCPLAVHRSRIVEIDYIDRLCRTLEQ